jgi:hypothetical protein
MSMARSPQERRGETNEPGSDATAGAAPNYVTNSRRRISVFFDARTEWTLAEFIDRHSERFLIHQPNGYVSHAAWKGVSLAAGYSDGHGCHLISPNRSTLEDLSTLMQK